METWAKAEMLGANVKDARRRNSLAVILQSLERQPGRSFSAATGPAGRQAATRLFADETVSVEDLMSGHRSQTCSRIKDECDGRFVLIVQDTTEFDFTRRKATTGLGYINHTLARGIFAHSALAITTDGLPLGVIHLEQWTRDDEDYGKSENRRNVDITEKESYPWINTLQTVEKQLPADQAALYVQDREADIFEFPGSPKRSSSYILVRAAHPRCVEVCDENDPSKPERTKLFDAVCRAPVLTQMDVTIPKSEKRPERAAKLTVQATSVKIMPPAGKKSSKGKAPITAWVIRAFEIDSSDEERVEWVLISAYPITDGETACKFVKRYSIRWTIERLHLTLKTGGCNAEKLQFDDAHSLKMAIALYYITAWRLLYIAYLGRVHPDAPVTRILDVNELEVLEAQAKKAILTISDAIRMIGKLGGHEPYKGGPPAGIKVLWIGLRRLEDMAHGWMLAKQGIPLFN